MTIDDSPKWLAEIAQEQCQYNFGFLHLILGLSQANLLAKIESPLKIHAVEIEVGDRIIAYCNTRMQICTVKQILDPDQSNITLSVSISGCRNSISRVVRFQQDALVELYAKGLIQDDVKSDDCGKEPLPVSGLWRTVANKFIEFVTVDNVTRLRWANRTSDKRVAEVWNEIGLLDKTQSKLLK